MSIRMSVRRCRVALLAAAAVALASTTPAFAAGGSVPATTRPVPGDVASLVLPPLAPPPAVIVSSLVAFLDPDTGQLIGPISWLVPPAYLAAATVPVVLEEEPLPDGGWLMDTKGAFMESYVLQIDALGNRSVQCVQGRGPVALPTAAVPAAGRGR